MHKIIIYLLAGIFMSTFAVGADGYNGPKEKLHVYLLIGQSNMAGRAPYTEAEAAPIDNCYLLNQDGEWEAATNPLNRHSTIRKGLGMQKMNPGYVFSQKMLEAGNGASVGLVVNAKGGTNIDSWKKGSRFYEEAVRRARQAQETGVIKGILWHQGESNHKNPEGYLEKLVALVNDLRSDLESPELPFVAGQVLNLPSVNEQIAVLPEKLKGTAYVSSEGLKGQDRWHFDAASMKTLGERYAEKMKKLQTDQ